jgi:16S rRNA (guanine(966)-N(2))-methyltransferase RsmD
MRIISGTFRSRSLEAPTGLATRPTSDRLRETLFNVLAPRIEGAALLDLYAGSGAVGLEAISRGAGQVVFVERAPAALKALHANIAKLRIQIGFRVDSNKVASALRRLEKGASQMRFDIVFLDPPYEDADEYTSTLGQLGGGLAGILDPGAVVIAEHRRKQGLEPRYGVLHRYRLLEQGDAALSFYRLSEPEGDVATVSDDSEGMAI